MHISWLKCYNHLKVINNAQILLFQYTFPIHIVAIFRIVIGMVHVQFGGLAIWNGLSCKANGLQPWYDYSELFKAELTESETGKLAIYELATLATETVLRSVLWLYVWIELIDIGKCVFSYSQCKSLYISFINSVIRSIRILTITQGLLYFNAWQMIVMGNYSRTCWYKLFYAKLFNSH